MHRSMWDELCSRLEGHLSYEFADFEREASRRIGRALGEGMGVKECYLLDAEFKRAVDIVAECAALAAFDHWQPTREEAQQRRVAFELVTRPIGL